jgi:hypothetical protein
MRLIDRLRHELRSLLPWPPTMADRVRGLILVSLLAVAVIGAAAGTFNPDQHTLYHSQVHTPTIHQADRDTYLTALADHDMPGTNTRRDLLVDTGGRVCKHARLGFSLPNVTSQAWNHLSHHFRRGITNHEARRVVKEAVPTFCSDQTRIFAGG